MNAASWKRVRKLFEGAIDLEGAARERFLAETCVGDDEVRREIEALLAADAEAADFLEPAPGPAPAPTTGERVGRYVLGRLLGSGGMGVVYEAAQEEPRRKVALKMMRRGLRSSAAVRRFRFEAEVLARLHHAAIAQVYESGTYREGDTEHPYFAMELVEGARDLLAHAQEEELSTASKIELFARVCDAIHHGHQRGVVHRDLKPGNLLVDSDGDPKVIDFGVARVTGSDREAVSSATLPGQVLGTLQYMSPEQIGGRHEEVDVRSDVYSLGCILHELATGEPLHDFTDLSLAQVANTIEQADPRPHQSLADELGWIIVKCLVVEPERRYASASELAEDLRRFVRHEAVLARPPSRSYRLRKLMRRHRVLLTSTVLVVLALALGLVRAEREARITKRALLAAESAEENAWEVAQTLQEALASVSPLELGDDVRVTEVLEQAAARIDRNVQPGARAAIQNAIGRSYMEQRRFEEARRYIGAALEYVETELPRDDPLSIDVHANQTRLLLMTYGLASGEELGREVEPLALEQFGELHPVTLRVQGALAELLLFSGKYDEAERRYDTLIERLASFYGADHGEVIGALGGRALVWQHSGRLEEAVVELERIVALADAVLSPGHFRGWNARANLARALTAAGRFADAEPLLHQILAHYREIYGDADVTSTAPACEALGALLASQGRFEEARGYLAQAQTAFAAALGEDSEAALFIQCELVQAYRGSGEEEAAEELLRAALEVSLAGADQPLAADIVQELSELLFETARPAQARELLERAYAEIRELSSADTWWLLGGRAELARELRRDTEVEAVARECLALYRAGDVEDDSLRPQVEWLLGDALWKLGQLAAAEEVLSPLRAELSELDRPELTCDVLKTLVHVLEEQGRSDDARQLLGAELATSDPGSPIALRCEELLAHLRDEHTSGD